VLHQAEAQYKAQIEQVNADHAGADFKALSVKLPSRLRIMLETLVPIFRVVMSDQMAIVAGFQKGGIGVAEAGKDDRVSLNRPQMMQNFPYFADLTQPEMEAYLAKLDLLAAEVKRNKSYRVEPKSMQKLGLWTVPTIARKEANHLVKQRDECSLVHERASIVTRFDLASHKLFLAAAERKRAAEKAKDKAKKAADREVKKAERAAEKAAEQARILAEKDAGLYAQIGAREQSDATRLTWTQISACVTRIARCPIVCQ